MSSESTVRRLVWLMVALGVMPSIALGAESLSIARMKVTIMPEYDSPAVLVVEEGKFADRGKFPAKVRFNLPAEITRLTDVCSLSPGGHHFCQLFELKSGDGKNYIDIRLPYADFFIDYQYAPFTVKPDSDRDFIYRFDPVNDVDRLEVHIQQPARASKYGIDPAGGDPYEKDGFTYRKYVYDQVKAGAVIEFHIAYHKAGIKPSVDEQFSAMKTPELFDGATGEWLLGLGIGILVAVTLYRTRKKTKGGGP